MKQYEEYKTTNISWLDKIPKHWNELRGKLIYKKVDRNPEENDEVITCFRDGQVTLRKNRRLSGYTESIKEIGYQHINKGDLVIHIMDAFAGAIGVSDSNGKGSPVYNVCVSRICVNNYFYAYLLREMARNGYISSLYRGIRERSSDFRFNVFANQIYPVPPREEQDKIVAYLDYQTSNINKLILSKRKQIELLEEYKKTKISEVVTKGLNPNAEMKESGIDWIGQIPKHWEVKRLKEILLINGRIGFRGYGKNDIVDNNTGALSLSPINILNGKLIYDKCTYISYEKYYESPEIMVKNGDIIFVKTGSSYGKSCIVNNIFQETTINPQLILFNNFKIDEKYLYYTLQSNLLKDQIDNAVIGGTIPTINQNKIANFNIIIPQKNEINIIVEYLDDLIFKLDNLISKHKLYIEKLEEYKKILISDVVTGKIDVRDSDIPEYEKIEINEGTEEKSDDEVKME